MEIYITGIEPLRDKQLFLEKMKEIPKERRRKIERYKSKEEQMRGLAAGLLLEYGLNRYGLTLSLSNIGKRHIELTYGSHGKPGICKEEGVCFNLSHSGEYVAAVFAGKEIGVDIEQHKETDAGMKVAHRFFTQEEYTYLKEIEGKQAGQGCQSSFFGVENAFISLWTRKESYLKAVGAGMKLPMDSFSVLYECIEGERSYYLRTWEVPKGYSISVCSTEPIEAEPQLIYLME